MVESLGARAGCPRFQGKVLMDNLRAALASINAERLLEHIKILASDEFEGRQPGTTGEERTLAYLQEQCQSIGLTGAGPGGSYFQDVPVTGYRATSTLEFKSDEGGGNGGGKSLKPTVLEDYVAMTRHPSASLKNLDMLFVGYGIDAPEYGWNDYKAVDVHGKLLVMLVGDPRRPDPRDPSKLDDTFFRGNALTYYGRWTYKYEIGSKLGAAAVLIVHNTAGAGYAFDVVRTSWGGENFNLSADDEHRIRAEGWITGETAEKLAALGGQDWKKLFEAAQQQDFRPVELNVKASIDIENSARHFNTRNVVATIRGEDPKVADECIVYSAHWDHFGKREKDGVVTGIFSGAVDNGSGVSTILEIARAFHLAPPPRRTILFLFTTLEESGLLGAQFYVKNPLIPLDKTIAIINVDVMNVWGRTQKVVSIGLGHSDIDDVLAAEAAKQGRTITVDPEPDKGSFYRSDHLEFMRRGVPAIFFLHPGADFIDKPADFAAQKRKQYITQDYHKFSDKVKPDWDLSGLVEDTQLLFLAGMDIAQASSLPQWYPKSEFASARPPKVKTKQSP